MHVCVFICSGITLERLERFRPNLVHIWLYVCVRILCMFYISILFPKHHFQHGGWCGRPPWDQPSQGLPIAATVMFTQIGIEGTAR
jgi:hypothetical protein